MKMYSFIRMRMRESGCDMMNLVGCEEMSFSYVEEM